MFHHQKRPSGNEQVEVKTLLIVEDDTPIGEFLAQAIVQETPYQPILVTDSFAALKVSQDIKPDLLLLDYHLPRMNGIELYDRLHALKEREAIPTILLSASLPLPELKKRKMMGFSKPIELLELLDAIEQGLADHTKES